MIYDARTSKILAQAKQRRADAIGDFMTSHSAAVVLALGLGALLMTLGHGVTADTATASNHAEVAHADSR